MLSLEPVSGDVKVGNADHLGVTDIDATRPIWPSEQPLPAPTECRAQIRAHGDTVGATAEVTESGVSVRLAEPMEGVAPGQSVVLYSPEDEGDLVLGSAVISATR